MRWFTCDTHFGHKNVIDYCQRPFSSVEVMEAELIRRWNICVKPGDTVFHLGDAFFCGAIKTAEIMKQLNGDKILIRGNHDHRKPEKYHRLGFTYCEPYLNIIDSEVPLTLSHYPYKGEEADERTFSEQLEDKGGWLLHGHVHCAWKTKKKMINVGVDVWDFSPVSEEEIISMIQASKGERK